jgi:hypothetical protein
MLHRVIEADGRTLEEARKKIEDIARAELPLRLKRVHEHVVADGREKRTRASAAFAADALALAEAELPPGAIVLERRHVANPTPAAIVVEAVDETEARARASARAPEGTVVTTVKLARAAATGFLGVGRRPSAFRAELAAHAVVELRWCLPVKLRVEFADVAHVDQSRVAAWREQGDRQVACWFCGTSLQRQQASVVTKDALTRSSAFAERALILERQRIWGPGYALAPYDHAELAARVGRLLDSAPSVIPMCESCVADRIPGDVASQAMILRPGHAGAAPSDPR